MGVAIASIQVQHLVALTIIIMVSTKALLSLFLEQDLCLINSGSSYMYVEGGRWQVARFINKTIHVHHNHNHTIK